MKKIQIIFALLFVLLCLSVGVTTIALPDRSFSDNENRTLVTREDVSTDFFGGNFQQWLTDYLTDQFPLKDVCTELRNRVALLMGKKDIGGVYVCKDRYIQKITDSDIDFESYRKTVARFNRLAEKTGLPVTVMPVPSAGISLPDSLPENAQMYDSQRCYSIIGEEMKDCRVVDLRSTLAGDESAYYTTDHHWTTAGAFKAFEQWQISHGRTAGEVADYGITAVTDGFRGSLFSKAPDSRIKPESIAAAGVDSDLTVTADGKEINLYIEDCLKEKDKYKYFLGGNYGIVVIENNSLEKGETLLVVKDSFANSIVPFLLKDYKKIILLDPRYAAVSVPEYAVSVNADEIAIIEELWQLQ